MTNNYFNSLIFGIMGLTINIVQSQNILSDGDFSLTTEIIPFNTPPPPIDTWAFFLNSANGVEANPTIVGGVLNYQIINPGNNTWEVQLAQWGFPLILGHSYQLMFDVKADADRSFGVYLGEEGGNWIDLIGYDRYFYNATTEWQTISIEFEAFTVFPLHKLSFELGANSTTTYFDNVLLQDLGPAPPDKIIIAGTFQSTLNCAADWDPKCEYTELTFNSSTGLYTGTFQIPAGNHRYKVTVGGTWDINYGENGLFNGPDIFLCVPSDSEEVTFTYDPATNLVITFPVTSGFSPDCLPLVVLAGTFQDELGCEGEWVPDCANTALIYNPGSGLFEGDLNIPSGCYEYLVVLENSWQNNYGQEGIHNGLNYILSVPANPVTTHFTYDPVSHIVSSTPYSGALPEVTKVSLLGNLQNEVGCGSDYDYECDYPALVLNPDTGAWEGSFSLPSGCYNYRVKETFSCNVTIYGENGWEGGSDIQLYVPSEAEVTFSYDPQTHIITSTPYSGVLEEITTVSLIGTLQYELGCAYDFEYECNKPGLLLNPNSGKWEGSFMLPAGCYIYRVKETFGCNIVSLYGENGIEEGNEIQLYVPSAGEVTFSYDPQTHIISSPPYGEAPQEVTTVSLQGTFQEELGCAFDYEYDCNIPALHLNPDSGAWEGSFTLPAGCYNYLVKETFGCSDVTFYGENGILWGNELQLFVPIAEEISFSYNPQTHILSSTPYSGAPQEVTKVSLLGNLQEELGCAYDYEFECDNSALQFNPDSGAWEGSFSLPAGCYNYFVKETFGCKVFIYDENGTEGGIEIQLYVPIEGEITFSYNPETHIIASTPYSGFPQEVTQISLIGTLQDELGCAYDYETDCDNTELFLNPDSGAWEKTFTLPAGCYSYQVKETFACNIIFYGENGIEWGNPIQLYVPSDGEITFSYDPQTHIMSSTPYTGVPQEATKVSLVGTLQDELGCDYDYQYDCDNPALLFDPKSGTWEGSFSLPSGCYTFLVKETSVCENIIFYGENGTEWGTDIQLYIPIEGEITFSYNSQTHILSSTPYSGAPQEVTKVSLIGTLQDELGCDYDYQYECDNPALQFNPESGAWEGSFTLPAGCYSYLVKEAFGCKVFIYDENGTEEGSEIQLYVPVEGEITFSYNPETHIITSTPNNMAQVTAVSLLGTLQSEVGCADDYDFECNKPELQLNSGSGEWEGSFILPAGCYTYWVKETSVCNVTYYGENGIVWGNQIQLFVPSDGEITFGYNPQTHIISSSLDGGTPLEVTAVSLIGTLQSEVGCADDYDFECNKPELQLNSGSGEWEGSFILPAGCYTYWVKETSVCNVTYYGENGIEYGNGIQIYVPSVGEITFSYNPQTHIISSSPDTDISMVIQCPGNVIVDNSPGECGAIVDYPEFTVPANCEGEIFTIIQIQGLPSGSFFPVGITTNSFLLTKITGEEITCSFDVVVTDIESPVISGLKPSQETLWPPNHKMVPVLIEYSVTDNCNIPTAELSISSNEPENGPGADQAPDWEILDEHNVLLRAERSAQGDGREYYITIKLTDSSGNFTEQFVTVLVPRNGTITNSEFDTNKYTLYPNGADDIINIKGPKSLSNYPYVIYDMLGVLKKQGTIDNDQIEVNSLPTGIYILKFEVNESYIWRKFIKN